MRKILAVLALASACRGAPSPAAAPTTRATVAVRPAPPPPPPAESASTREQRLVARMMERVSKARGLAATKPVPGVMLDRAALIAEVKKHVDREVPHDAIVHEGRVQQLLGFVPTRFDYEAATYALLEAELAGFYEPSDGTMYMAADLDDDNAYATLAHELVHALQDQRWDLGPRSRYTPGEGDASGALSALAEGDATSLMADILIGQARPGATALDMPDELFVEQVIGSLSGGAAADTPHVMRMGLVAPYIDGTLFIHALRRKGGWPAVNRAWETPPKTTEQILHVDKWDKHEAALAVDPPRYAALGAGWSTVDADTYGELGLRLALGEWLGAGKAGALAAGWGGDRGVLLKKGDAFAFAWRVRYDEGKAEAHASEVLTEVSASLDRLSKGHALKVAGASVCIDRGDTGPLLVARAGRDLLVLAGPAVVAPKAWTAAGRCATAKRWAAEAIAP